jgi:hypothetical protein
MENGPFIIAFSADSDQKKKGDADPDSVFERIKEENPHRYIFGGDGPYAKTGKKWTELIDKYGLKNIMKIAQGNHDCKESESEQTEKDIEEWMPDLKITPEVDPNELNWTKPKWIHSWQDRNVFFIVMNSSDMQIPFKKNQYNWVVKQLEKVKNLKAEGKVDWMFGIMHKPWYTLQTNHAPEVAIRQIYQPLFDEVGFDFMLYGHNHDHQVWLPMAFEATQKFTKLPDGSYDFSAPHGQFHIVNGAGGHEINQFQENWKDNKNVLYANDKEFCYTLFKIDGNVCDIVTKNTGGQIIFSMKVTK